MTDLTRRELTLLKVAQDRVNGRRHGTIDRRKGNGKVFDSLVAKGLLLENGEITVKGLEVEIKDAT